MVYVWNRIAETLQSYYNKLRNKGNEHMNEKYKYKQIESYIYERIQSGEYAMHALLPTQAWFCEHFHVSRATVHYAFQELIENGLVESIQGSGSYVRAFKKKQQNIHMSSFSEEYTNMGYQVTTKLLFYTKKQIRDFKNRALSKKLEALPSDYVHYFERVRLGNGEPLAVQYTYILEAIIPHIPLSILEGSIYTYIEDTVKLSIAQGSNDLTSVLPSDEIAKLLRIPQTEPVMYLSHISRLSNGIAFEYVDMYTRYDKFSLHYINKRKKEHTTV